MTPHFKSICRLCMAKEDVLVPIFDEEGILSSRIMSLVPVIKLYVGDGLPSQVCQQCVYHVNTSYKFRLQCESSDATLQQYLNMIQPCSQSYLVSTELNAVKEETLHHTCEKSASSDYSFQEDDQALKVNVLGGVCSIKQNKSSEATFEIKMFTEDESCAKADKISIGHSDLLPNESRHEGNIGDEEDVQISIVQRCSTNGSPREISESEESAYDYNTELLICHMCDKTFPCKSKLKEHSTKHTGVRPYVCRMCGKRFTRQSSLNVHMLSHTGQKPHACDVCGKQFTQLSSLKSHALIHTGQKPRVCEVCGRRFARLDNLKSHVLIHSGHKSYVCEVCGKMFNKLALLKTHAMTHTERKPLFCDVCGKSFVNVYSFKTHALIHSGEKPFSCGICKKSFTLKNSLKIHIQTHTGLKPHQCGVCGKRFSQSHSLKTHAVVHTGQKPFSCQICGKCFKQRHTLKKHVAIHTA